MALNNPSPGFFSVNEFQVSPLPWLISGTTSGTSVTKYAFPKVSKSVTIQNLDSSNKLRLGVTLNGVNGVGGNYYFVINAGALVQLDLRATEIYVRADTSNSIAYSIYAGLTTISAGQMPILSGTLSDGPGWSGVG
jgi:hypothetical protein